MRTVRFVFKNRELICSAGKSLPWLVTSWIVISRKNPTPILHMLGRVMMETGAGKRRVHRASNSYFYV